MILSHLQTISWIQLFLFVFFPRCNIALGLLSSLRVISIFSYFFSPLFFILSQKRCIFLHLLSVLLGAVPTIYKFDNIPYTANFKNKSKNAEFLIFLVLSLMLLFDFINFRCYGIMSSKNLNSKAVTHLCHTF